MKNLKIKPAIWILVIISALAFLILKCIQSPDELSFITLLKLLSQVVSIDVAVVGLFISWLWKFPIFKGWLVPFPNLNGTWKGEIYSSWVNPETGDRPGPIPAILTVKQNFISVSCVMRTAEMTSRSIASDFLLDEDNQLIRLIYSYDSQPKQTVQNRSPQHCGTQIFDIDGNSLQGSYWTGRKTTGEIKLDFWRKDHVNSFPEGLKPHPVSNTDKNRK